MRWLVFVLRDLCWRLTTVITRYLVSHNARRFGEQNQLLGSYKKSNKPSANFVVGNVERFYTTNMIALRVSVVVVVVVVCAGL